MLSKKSILIITGSELRHEFFRKYVSLSESFTVVKTFCESELNSIRNMVEEAPGNLARRKHLAMREETEKDFFQLFCATIKDKSNPEFITKGDINLPEYITAIIDLQPDLIITYGCSIIKAPLIEAFRKKIINIHLGLSPWYRGSGTNFWPFVNKEPEYTGVSFMYMDAGVDTGAIIHQIQARINYGDNIHQVGNRLIRDMAGTCIEIINHFDELEIMPAMRENVEGKYYRNKDFTESAVEEMYRNFSEGLVDNYLSEIKSGKRKLQLITNPVLDRKTVCS
jgi:phosphoribosylglycinamide formyltransferase 1